MIDYKKLFTFKRVLCYSLSNNLHLEKKGYMQQMLADKIGIHVTQIKRCEAKSAQPTMEVFRKIVLALKVSVDMMLLIGMNVGRIKTYDFILRSY